MRQSLILLAMAVSIILTGPAKAHEDPFDFSFKYYRVTGVEQNDTLNVRTEPSASSQIIGTLQPDSGPHEVVMTKDGWGQIVHQEFNGWVALRYLAEVEVEKLGDSSLPAGLTCGGTEPFWGISFPTAEQAIYTNLSIDGPRPLDVVAIKSAIARFHVQWFDLAKDGADVGHAVIRRSACSDGMSDRTYPYSPDLSVVSDDMEWTLEGCCYLPEAASAGSD